MPKKKPPPPPPPVSTPASAQALLSTKQVSILLGGIGRSTLRDLIRRGEFPQPDVRLGLNGCLPRWSTGLFNSWVESRVARAKAEVQR